MFTIIEMVVSILDKLMQAYYQGKDRREDKVNSSHKKSFATKVVTCYFRLLEVIEGGDLMISHVEHFVRMKKQDPNSDLRHEGEYLSGGPLKQQSINVSRLASSFYDLKTELMIFLPDVEKDLDSIQKFKTDLLHELGNSLHSGKILLESSDLDASKHVFFHLKPNAYIDSNDDWNNSEVIKSLELYLENKPRERLNKLKVVAENLREFLISNFKIEEVLWSTNEFKDTFTFRSKKYNN